MKHTIHKTFLGALCIASFGISAFAQSTYAEFRKAAEEKQSKQDYKGAIESFEKAMPLAVGDSEKSHVYAKLVWLYAWGSNPNRFDKAAEMQMLIGDLASTNPKNRAGNYRAAADYLLRIKDYDREKIYAVIEKGMDSKELAPEDKAMSLIMMARVINEKDSAKAKKCFDEAVKLDITPAVRNKCRMDYARILNSGAKPDTDGAVTVLNSIISDTASTPKEKFNAVMEAGRAYANAKPPKFAESNIEFAKAANIDGITEADKNEAAIMIAGNLEREKTPDYAKIIDAYRKAAANKGGTLKQRMDASKKMLRFMRGAAGSSEKDIESVYELMWQFDGIDGNTAREISELSSAYYNDMKNFDKALSEAEKCLSFDKEKNPVHIAFMKGKIYARKGDYANAVKFYTEAGKWQELATLQLNEGKKDLAFKTVLDTLKNDEKQIKAVIGWLSKNSSYKEFAVLLEKDLKPFLEKDASLGREFEGKVKQAMQDGAYEFVIAASPYAIAANPSNGFNYLYRMNSFAQLGKNDEARKVISECVSNPAIKDNEFIFRFKIIDAALKAGTKDKALVEVKKLIEEYRKVITDQKKLATVIGRAGGTLLMMNMRPLAEAVTEARHSLYAFLPNQSVKCEFVDNLPVDLTGWMASPMVKSKRNIQKIERVPWEDNVEFLLATDVATGDRSVAQAKGKVETDLYTFCDAKGVYVLIIAYDDNAKNIADGLANGGSYEGYLAPGYGQPYYCFLTNIANGKTDDFKTAYKNPMTRRPTFAGGDLKSETRLVADNAIATLLMFPWEFFYNTLPDAKGDTWQFDVMRWTGPGYSWSGMKSVHNRSTWGDFVFDLTPEQLTAIRRNIVIKARQEYNKAVGSPWRGSGIFNFWSDTELGDVEFYKEKLVPLKEKLDAYSKEVTPDMTPETINRLFVEAVPSFINTEYIVNEMRRNYLDDKNFK